MRFVNSAYIRYCSVMAAPRRLLSSMNSLMNSCSPVLENLLHAAVLEPGAHRARMALGRPLAAIGAGDVVEVEHEVLVAARSERGISSRRIRRSAISHGFTLSR